jgi:hypothetical protein
MEDVIQEISSHLGRPLDSLGWCFQAGVVRVST